MTTIRTNRVQPGDGPRADRFAAAANYDESKVRPYVLPDPLVANDGSRITTRQEWARRRRPELLELFAREVYGRTPVQKPADMHWRITAEDDSALGGKAVRREVTLWFGAKQESPALHLLIHLPKRKTNPAHAWPAFLGLNFFGNQSVHPAPAISLARCRLPEHEGFGIVNHGATDKTRGVHAGRWDIETVIARGYATVTGCYHDLCEDRPEGLERGIADLFRAARGASGRSDAGAIAIWAWGLSRSLDYLESDGAIDARRVAVHGHSRLGKAALWAGAQDERFALVIANESGCGGAAVSRRNFGESIAMITERFPHWFAPAFRDYADRETDLPIDQHALLALIAPRAIHIGSADDDRWADPSGEFLGLKAAEPVYRLCGARGLDCTEPPSAGSAVWGDRMAYHLRPGPHDMTPVDWEHYLGFADRVLRPQSPDQP